NVTTKCCLVSSLHDAVREDAFVEQLRFRREFYGCLTSRADAVFELTDAVLCADGPVRSLAELSLVGEHRRGHGSSYAALADGRIDIERLRTILAGVALPRAADGRLVLAVDVTCWLRPDAHTPAGPMLCQPSGRGKGRALPGPPPPGTPPPPPAPPPRHGAEFSSGAPGTWGHPPIPTQPDTRLYGTATALAWDRLHPRLTRRAAWAGCGELPIIAGTVIRLQVDRLPSGAIPKPVWLWWSSVDAIPADVDRLWQAFLRRFDIEHTFRMWKQTLGWTCPKIRTPQAADRWTWLILAAYTQLRLTRPPA